MNRPKGWAEVNQRRLVHQIIEWDGEKTSETINLPLAVRPLNVAVDNALLETTLTMTLEHLLRVDDTNASAQIGSGATGTVTITRDEAGRAGDEYIVKIIIPESEEATDLIVELVEKTITIALAVDATGTPDNTKNTALLIAAAINDEEDGIEGFTAEASGDGSGVFTTATEDPVQFSGGTTDIWAPLYDTEGNELSLTVAGKKRRVVGPFTYFPRFLGGRIKLANDIAPADESITIVQVVEG